MSMTRNSNARKVPYIGGHVAIFGHFPLQITSLFMVRKINCGGYFSLLGQTVHVATKIEQIRRTFLFCD